MKLERIMDMLHRLKSKIQNGLFEFSKHAVDQNILRNISVREIQEAFEVAEIIEDYPEDKYGPSCLLLGFTYTARAIHIQCSYPSRPLVKIITLYDPEPDRWIDFRTRRFNEN